MPVNPALADLEHPLLPILRSASKRRALIAAAIFAAVAGGIYLVRDIATPVLAALGLAYIFVPVVNAIEKKLRVPRVLVVTALMIGVAVVAVGVIALVVPALVAQVSALAVRLPAYATHATAWIEQTLHIKIPTDSEQVLAQVKEYLGSLAPGTISRAGSWIATVLAGGAGAISGIISFVLVPLFLFFFLKDWTSVTGSMMTLVPKPMQSPIKAKLVQIDRSLSAYVRGVLTVATILAVIYSVALSALGVPLGLLIGVLAGFAYVVPFMSSLLGITLGVLFSLLEFHGFGQVAGVLIIFVIGNMIESFILTPRIVGDSLGLPPMAVILAVMIGANLFGFLGVLIALPGAAVVNVVGRDLIAAWKSSQYYRTGPEAP